MQQLLIGNLHAKWLMPGPAEAASRKRSHSIPKPGHICHGYVYVSVCVCVLVFVCSLQITDVALYHKKLCQHKVQLRFQLPLAQLLGRLPSNVNFVAACWSSCCCCMACEICYNVYGSLCVCECECESTPASPTSCWFAQHEIFICFLWSAIAIYLPSPAVSFSTQF